MSYRNRSLWQAGATLLLLLLLLTPPVGVSALAPIQQAEPAQTDSLVDNAHAAYAIQPVLNAARQGDAQQYAAINPALAWQLRFEQDQVTVAPLTAGEDTWRFTLALATDASETNIYAAGNTQTIAVTRQDNRLHYQWGSRQAWFRNTADGVQHGLAVQQRPSDQSTDQPIQLYLRLGGTLQPKLNSDQQSVDFVTASGAILLRYGDLLAVDAQGQILPASFRRTATRIILVIDDRRATYPLTVTSVLTNYLVKQTMTAGAANDFLGYDVNVSGDTVVVGAYGDDNDKGVDAGSATIYLRHQGGINRWQAVRKLEASDGAAGDEFGRDTYVTSGTTVIVGAPGQDQGGENAGAAYIFGRDQGGPSAWGQEAKLTPSDAKANQRFGAVVAVQNNSAVIGVPTADSRGAVSGAVYVFDRVAFDPPVWQQRKRITPDDGAAGDRFGAALVISGDTLFVGAPGDDDACGGDAACDAGAVYIFERNMGGPNNWGLLKKVMAADGATRDAFGHAVAYSDNRLFVGAPLADTNGADAGAAYIFNRNFGGFNNWGERKKVVATDGVAGQQFGYAVGIGGIGAIVGAPFDQENGLESGAAYILHRNANGSNEWGEMTKVIAPDGVSGDHFGRAVDHRSGNAVIGAYGHDANGSNAGAIYLYRFPFTFGSLQIANRVQPVDPNASWQVTIQGLGVLTNTLTGDAQMEPVNLFAGNYTVTARVGSNTNANNYSTTWQCLVNDAPGPAGNGITFTISVNTNEKVLCTFTHTPPTATGAIVIAQESTPSGGTGFPFTDNIAAPNNFTLNDSGQQSFATLVPGIYQVTAGTIAGWQLTGIRCVDPDNGSTASGATATIDLDAGETVFCTFTSKQSIPQIGTIVINNQSTPLGVGFVFTQTITTPTSFLVDAGGSKTFMNVPADSYEVAAVPPAEWRVASVTCIDPDNGSTTSGATAVIDLDAGETVSCTFSHQLLGVQGQYRLFLPLADR